MKKKILFGFYVFLLMFATAFIGELLKMNGISFAALETLIQWGLFFFLVGRIKKKMFPEVKEVKTEDVESENEE